ncbi:REST corepressor 1-like [Cyanistes caeruleus]|uniref:REST corepressor 1-like n=1 Tax=Cyanistes caeruleus TaxID=156563 RepID=UPI000CDA2BCD|nr:REST corepressor 1-like [Cyanistes caeruleus]
MEGPIYLLLFLPDSDIWTPEEKESFEKAFHTYGKDFHLIQKQVQSKAVAQCVEYYYTWKKEHKLAKSLAQVSGKKIKTRPEGGETGRRGQNLLASLGGTALPGSHCPVHWKGAADAAQALIIKHQNIKTSVILAALVEILQMFRDLL